MSTSSKKQSHSFLYFAYGSNLLTERIRINNPSAKKITIGKIDEFRLDFLLYGKRWHGNVATIVPDKNAYVWGVVWEIDDSDRDHLDRQEQGYVPIDVDVLTPDRGSLSCITYQQPIIDNLADARPSVIYKNVIIKGAMENNLPEDYIAQLKQIRDNGYDGPVEVNLSDSLRNG